MNKIITTSVLSNGLTLVSLEPDLRDQSIYLELTVRNGGRDDNERQFGLAHFTEHIVAHIIGINKRQDNWLGDYILDSFDAYTDQEKTTYYAAAAKEDLVRSLKLILCPLDRAGLSKAINKSILSQTQAIISEELLGSLDEEDSPVRLSFAKQKYGNTPLGRGDVLGTLQTIQSFTVNDVQEYLEQRYLPQRMFLVTAGGLGSEDIASVVEKSLPAATMPPSISPNNPETAPMHHPNKISFYDQDDHQNRILWSKNIPITNIKHSITLLILLGMLQRFLEFFGRKNYLFYSLDVGNAPHRDHFSITIDSSCSPAKFDSLHEWLFRSLSDFEAQLNDATLTTHKHNLLQSTRLDLAYPKVALDTAAWYQYYFNRALTLEEEMDLISQTSTEDVIDEYQKLFKTKDFTLLVSGILNEKLKSKLESLHNK